MCAIEVYAVADVLIFDFRHKYLEEQPFRFSCCISSLQVTAEADVLGSCCVRFL